MLQREMWPYCPVHVTGVEGGHGRIAPPPDPPVDVQDVLPGS